MKFVSRAAVAALGLAVVVGMSACAPGTAANTAAPSVPTSVDPNSFGGKTLTYVYFTDGAADETATRNAVAGFEKATGAKVNLQIVPFANLNQTLQARVAGGNSPEVARVADWRPYASKLVQFDKYFGAEYPKEFAEASARVSTDDSGNMVAVPSDVTINGPFINVDAFKKANVAVPTKWTWDELVATATKVAKANGMQYPLAFDKSGHRLSTVLSQFGTDMLDGRKNALDKAKATAALGYFTDMVKKDTISRDFWLGSGSKYTGANEIFLSKQAPVYLSGPWQIGAFSKNATFEWAAVPNPCAERCGGFPGGKFMVAFNSSPEPTLAAYFVKWMNSAENQKAIAQTAFWLPTRADLTKSGIQYPQRNEDMKVFLDQIAATPVDTYASAFSPAFTQSATALITETDKVISGAQDVTAAVDALSRGIDEAIKAAG